MAERTRGWASLGPGPRRSRGGGFNWPGRVIRESLQGRIAGYVTNLAVRLTPANGRPYRKGCAAPETAHGFPRRVRRDHPRPTVAGPVHAPADRRTGGVP